MTWFTDSLASSGSFFKTKRWMFYSNINLNAISLCRRCLIFVTFST